MARVEPATEVILEQRNEVFVWGNGILGQLGLGRRGITKGRLAPHRLAALDHEAIVDLAAGANHSLALSASGTVFFWGHTEYGQSGRTRGAADYEVEGNLKFFEPQPVPGFPEGAVEKIACGATFSLALTSSGHVYSFGWNEAGVLGMGTAGRAALTPNRIPGLGPPHTAPCVDISCGHSHAFALTDVSSDAHIPLLRPLLGSGDVALVCKAAPKDFLSQVRSRRSSGGGEGTTRSSGPSRQGPTDAFFAHSFVLASRCEALKEMIAKSVEDGRFYDGPGPDETTEPQGDVDAAAAGAAPRRPLVVLDHKDLSPTTLRALLAYLYTDSLSCPPHRCAMP
mmetsp:Transcript_14294/g.42853  ORF Transcript_14294/g.42853 Transcript_14294/m.42853 type:complete len:339 (-) Transcript_14294:1008-2024(-)